MVHEAYAHDIFCSMLFTARLFCPSLDLLQLLDFSVSVPEALTADRDSPILLNYDVLNVGPDLPQPSLSSPHYKLVLRRGSTVLGQVWSGFPEEYYKPLPTGKRHRFEGIAVGAVLLQYAYVVWMQCAEVMPLSSAL